MNEILANVEADMSAQLGDVSPPGLARDGGDTALHAADAAASGSSSDLILPQPHGIDLSQQQLAAIVRSVAGGAANVQDIYPLTPLQEGMLFHRLLNERSDTYVLSTLLELPSRDQLPTLIDALHQVMDRHDVLRTAILWEGMPRPVQVVYRNAVMPVGDIALGDDHDVIEQLRELMKPVGPMLDLTRAPLARLRVANEPGGRRCYALLQTHHLICDHQSLRLIVSEVLAHLDGRQRKLPPVESYRSYVAEILACAKPAEEEEFFRSRLAGIEEPTTLFDLIDVHGDGSRVEEIRDLVEPQLARRVREQAPRIGVSVARMFHAAWAVVVAALSGRDDIVFGTVLLATRQRKSRAQRMLGMSINTLPLRLNLRGATARDLVDQTHRELSALSQHQQCPLTLAQSCSGIGGTAPLFTALLNYRRSLPESEEDIRSVTGVRVLARGEALTNYPLTVTVDDLGDDFALLVKTDRRVDPRRIAEYLQIAIRSLLEALEHAPLSPALTLQVLPERERRQVLETFNATLAIYPQDRLLHELFEAQVSHRPGQVAVVYAGESLSYSELNSRANRLARYLREHGVGPDQLVGLCVDRSLEMLVGLLAILKAGGAYVPLDPNYPAERLQHILDDAAPRMLLVQDSVRQRLPVTAIPVLAIDGDWGEIASRLDGNLDARACGLRSHHLAYVIYTSGSTGRPKGVMVEHRNVASLWHGLEQLYAAGKPCKRVGVNASFNFDASVKQLVQVFSGRTLVLIPQECRWDAARFLAYVREHSIESVDCTPWQLKSWLTAGLLNWQAGGLRVILVGGEPIGGDLWAGIARCPSIDFYNVYGPTESTVDTTFARINGDDSASHIGWPMENRTVYILDAYGRPSPIGVLGEIHIGGAGVARGYLNQPQLTAELFLPDPFGAAPVGRMYRSGDLGRWRGDGAIECLGRNDQQVKVRGFRIEPAEIEVQLLRHPQVKEAIVIAREDVPGEVRLVAYVVAQTDVVAPGGEILRAYLKDQLPQYMVPSAFVLLDRVPLSPSGKVDRRALPAPDLAAYSSLRYDAPEGEVEEIVAGIWQELLRLERVGRRDNFFELGGHSLLIVQMMERLRHRGLAADVRQVFESPTLADLASVLTHRVTGEFAVASLCGIPSGCHAITPQMLPLVELEPSHIQTVVDSVPGRTANVQDIYPLAPLQEGILFHYLLSDCGNDAYVALTLLAVDSRQHLDELIGALQRVIDRHDALRTAVLWEQLPRPVQVVYRHASLSVEELVLEPDPDPLAQVQDWMAPERQRMDIRHAPLIHIYVAADPRGAQWFALLQLHHMIADATSLKVIIAEVVALLEGRGSELAEPVPYRDHVTLALASARAHDADTFFRAKLGDVDEPTAQFGILEGQGNGAHAVEACSALDAALTKRVRARARRVGVSVATLFHAAWSLVIAATSGKNDIVFGSVLLGRMQGNATVRQTVGMFINTLPLRLRLEGLSAKELVDLTQRELVSLLAHEQASLAAAQRCSRVVGSAPLFNSLLNYRHAAVNTDAHWEGAPGVRALASRNRTNYPVTMSVDDRGDEFILTVQTDQRINPQRINGYLQQAVRALEEALEHAPDTAALALCVLPDVERREVLERFNDTASPNPAQKCVHELFEEQVRRTPDVTAVVHGQRSLTYVQISVQATQLAHRLHAAGVMPGALVGICAERSPEMVIALIATMKAGAAYVPFDPNHPKERLQYMIENAAPRVVLTQSWLQHLFSKSAITLIDIDETLSEAAAVAGSAMPLASCAMAAHPIYVIYTSGSTGLPKGTVMSHRAMANLLEWHRRELSLQPGQRVLQFAAFSFDVAFQETFSTLCGGGTLVLLDEEVRRDARALLALLNEQGVERLYVPPLMLQSLAECSKVVGVVPYRLRDVITAGEQLRITPEIVALFENLGGCKLHNHYGPTETHVVTALTLDGDPLSWPTLPAIGRPIANTQIYLLDGRRQPVPLQVAGEIYIAGENVALGYLRRTELTAERFVRDPFGSDPTARMYRTGDLGMWRGDGMLEYLGRNDYQVKIRGYRIELGEIEAQLTSHAQVREAALVAREDRAGDKRLIGYATVQEHATIAGEDLRAFLRDRLPDYMVPSAVVILKELPLTSSGKLDRRALPAVSLDAGADREYDAPQGEVEETLAGIWRRMLGVTRVGRHDNFFELGGHSLLVLQALFQIEHAFHCTLKVADVYKYPTLSDLAERIAGRADGDTFVDLTREATLDADIVPIATPPSAIGTTVLLTGATGFVGRFLLAQLLQDPNTTVHCLVRGCSDREARQRLCAMLSGWDLWCDGFEQRLVAIAGDLRKPRLGVDDLTYSSLAQSVDTIYHCATSMNHLETYEMAKAANVTAAGELLRLATQHRPKLVNYISTLGIFNATACEPVRVVHEITPIEQERHNTSRGYTASKWVGEKIFLIAADRGIPCNIMRLGLVWADAQRGRYDPLQRGHRILKSCLMSGRGIQRYRYETPATPVDYVARAIVFLAEQHRSGRGIFHISASQHGLEDVFERCNDIVGTGLDLLPLYDWIQEVKRLHYAGRSLPVVPLIEFAFSMDEATFREHQRSVRTAANVRFDCTRTQQELKQGGIATLVLDEHSLRACVQDMQARDPELRESMRQPLEGQIRERQAVRRQ